MGDFKKNEKEELMYLEKTLNFIKEELKKEGEILEGKFQNAISSKKEMWKESVHFSNDFDRIPDMVNYLLEVSAKNRDYSITGNRIKRYNKMIKSPYFGRFDFKEDSFDEVEKIYIGIYNLMDGKTNEIYVYDWRASISSIFYRSELGKSQYKSPVGIINGDVLLKRQYKIQDSELKYFFDSSIRINDEILQEVLSHNASFKMRNIVETIQKEQDLIIRDLENELLIVQGVAGSGKTSIALHRIAFLLYEGLNSKLGINNIIIISPNDTFAQYISNVLPELGEENVEQITLNDIISKKLGKELFIETREKQLEDLIGSDNKNDISLKNSSIEFKGSEVFVKILDRLIKYYEKNFIEFKDVYYDGKVVETKEQLKNFFLNNKINMPICRRLKRMENMILNKVRPMRKSRLEKIVNIVKNSDEHVFEIKSFSRLMAIREAQVFMKYIKSFTEVNYLEVYKLLFSKKSLFMKLAKGLKLPEDIDELIIKTNKQLQEGYITYEDSSALLYIKLILEGNEDFTEIKQVVIDEAQDYFPLNYHVFKLLFKGARYTVLGDFNQTLERSSNVRLYDSIDKILDKKKSVKLFMNKSYRSSYEINTFNARLLKESNNLISFERHEEEPLVMAAKNKAVLEEVISKDINNYFQHGYQSIAIICKTEKEARDIERRLSVLVDVPFAGSIDRDIKNKVVVIPSYMAKGLEFDVVIVYNASADNYYNEFHRRLLYIACSRALHQLCIYYTGEKTKFI